MTLIYFDNKLFEDIFKIITNKFNSNLIFIHKSKENATDNNY